MRLPRPAVKLLILADVLALGVLTTSAAFGSPTAAGRTQAVPAPISPDPGLVLRASRAVVATLPAAADGTASGGTVRLTVNPVTGVVCTTSAGIGQTLAAAKRLVLPTASTSSEPSPTPSVEPSTAAPTDSPGPAPSPSQTTPSPSPSDLPPATALGLSLALPDGTRLVLTGTSYSGCVTTVPSTAAGVLAAPASYAVLLVSTTGEEAVAPLTPAAAVGRPWSVGTRTETIVDRTRGTARRGRVPAQHSRTIRVTYYYPERGATDGSNTPASLEGPFPVALFSPGYAVTPQTYERTLHAWAAAGYLVAGVLSPGSGGGLPGTPTEADLNAQPRDLAVVLNTITKHDHDAASWLGGTADLTRVAVTGHSDGGSTATAAGLLQGYTDPRYDAVIVMAGASFGGQRARKALPLLVLSGSRDEYNDQSTFQHVFNLGHSTRIWVQAVGAHHLPPFVVAGTQADDLRALEIAFLDRSLFGANTRAAERSLGSQRGTTRIAAGSF